MPPKRGRRPSPPPKGLVPGEKLKRNKLTGINVRWGWVGTEVSSTSNITEDHRLETCGFSKRNKRLFCANRYALTSSSPEFVADGPSNTTGEPEDVIVISDDEGPPCSKKICKDNPYCLNYLGQDQWEDKDDIRESFLKALNLSENPLHDSRDPDVPVGLKNLGATCYANAFLQVWFRDMHFRNGVYRCQPSQEDQKFEESPIFQLQATFAALQESTRSVFNPAKLVESLKLRTSEQQDAQEFSKLFMSHLDFEFQKQSIPSLRSLLADQFQGKQVYGTICGTCGYRSERVNDFLEIEISFENNSKLADCIAALLQPEPLSGDNKYLCGHCQTLQDATRYTQLCRLPPVLHFSLLRFVYDVDSMERKKSKHTISFPTTLDMSRFMRSAAANNNIYELKGVLLHKGTSAYHGHYEAQVFDSTRQAWFQFNDETVTRIKTLGGKRGTEDISVIDIENGDGGHDKRQQKNARMKQTMEDSHDSVIDTISSKDAYMLIFSQKEKPLPHSPSELDASQMSSANKIVDVPVPPSRAMQVVNKFNAAHDYECELFVKRENEAKRHFEDIRCKVMHIYQSWNVSAEREDSVVISQAALETWLSVNTIANASKRMNAIKSKAFRVDPGTSLGDYHSGSVYDTDCSTPDEPRSIVSEISCTHRQLDPRKIGSMKCISKVAFHRILSDTNCSIHPVFSPWDVCKECVDTIFTERLYQIEHPRVVNRFDQCEEDSDSGYWISKQWIKDWRLMKPKMHDSVKGDPAPDAPDFNLHVQCEHGGLSLNASNRRRISSQACQILQELFPNFMPLSTDAELCAVCDALLHISKVDKLEVRRKAEDEKAKLKHMHDNALNGNTALLEHVPCAIVVAQFVRAWRQWLLRPSEIVRPDTIDNSTLLCEHSKLIFDPNCPGDLDSSIVFVKRTDWNVLEELYSGGPLIAVEKCLVGDGNNVHGTYIHDIPVCADCRHKRKSDFDVTDITIHILGAGDALPGTSTSMPASTNGRRYSGLRKSKRLQEGRAKRQKLTVMKTTTVKEIKATLQDEFQVPMILQRLYFDGEELEDNSATVKSLGILANDVLGLRMDREGDDPLDSDVDVAHVKKKRKLEERGFDGTLLGGGLEDEGEILDDVTVAEVMMTQVADGKICRACTFENASGNSMCSMCSTPFA